MQTKTLDSRWPTAVDSAPESADAKSDTYVRAERQMRRGRQLVIGGFFVAVLGIVAYSVAAIGAGLNQEMPALVENPGWLLGSTLGVVGLGTVLWLVGSFVYLSGAMDGDPDRPDPYL